MSSYRRDRWIDNDYFHQISHVPVVLLYQSCLYLLWHIPFSICRFIVIVLAYFLIGMAVQFVRGKRGVEVIPNFQFWKAFPLLVIVSDASAPLLLLLLLLLFSASSFPLPPFLLLLSFYILSYSHAVAYYIYTNFHLFLLVRIQNGFRFCVDTVTCYKVKTIGGGGGESKVTEYDKL